MSRRRAAILCMALISIGSCAQNDNAPNDRRLPPAPPAIDWDLVGAPEPANLARNHPDAENTWPRFVMDAKLWG